jgi:hypothetical protein
VRRAFLPLASLLALGDLACHSGAPAAGGPGGGADAGGSQGVAGAPGPDGGAAGAMDAGPSADALPPGFDPGSVGIRRLSDAEYTRTLRDLLGVTDADADLLAPFGTETDPLVSGRGFYDDAWAAGTASPARLRGYFANAVKVVEEVVATKALRDRVVTCAPAGPSDAACATAIVRAFGLRAWRRPLTDAEVADLVGLVRADLDTGDDFPTAIGQALVAMLVSESFLYRMELDPPAAGAAIRPLTSYELAARLSYLVWSSMPDDALFQSAAADALRDPNALVAETTRMLADPRADGFVRNFFGQWLGFRALDGATFDFPADWSADLQASAAEEARRYVAAVVQGDGDIGGLVASDMNFVDSRLATLYGFAEPDLYVGVNQVTNVTDSRKGYLGLAAFFVTTSDPTTSSPTRRGLWVMDRALCTDVPAPPGGVPSLTPVPGATPRENVEAIANMPSCGPCHALMDPVGLGLEGFDQLGRSRTSYGGDLGPVDDHGALGTKAFEGEPALADLVAADTRFADCARRQLFTYALGRSLGDADAPRFPDIDARWTAGGHSVRSLLSSIVADEAFRYRRGESP